MNDKAIKEIKDNGAQAIKEHFEENASRGSEAVKEYTAMSNQTKAASLRYKLEHGMFKGKTPEQMERIRENLEKLEAAAC